MCVCVCVFSVLVSHEVANLAVRSGTTVLASHIFRLIGIAMLCWEKIFSHIYLLLIGKLVHCHLF